VCSYFGYSRQAWYWRRNDDQKVAEQHEIIVDEVRKLRRDHPRMGGKKLYHLLNDSIHRLAPALGRDKFFDLLRSHDLLVRRRRKYVVTTQSFQRFFLYKDHYNGISWSRSHQAWVSDITYIRVGEGFMYLFLITDAFSRKIVGWQLAHTLESIWALKALEMAVKQCPDTEKLVHHSDRGFQYCSHQYIKLLNKQKIIPSMGEAGYCYDNAMAERVNGILKDEYLLDSTFNKPEDALGAVKQAIGKYNEKRPHWSLGLQIPARVHVAA
jgi:Transposase and inactivated derivatives